MDQYNVGMMLEPGESRVFPSADFEDTSGCGLIPLGTQKCKLATTGYKWNLGKFNHPRQHVELAFGTFISTSNKRVSESIGVDTDSPLFYCSSLIFKEPKL